MIKHFCDECGKELTSEEIDFCSKMIGIKEFCIEHVRLWADIEPKKYAIKVHKENRSGFVYVDKEWRR